MNSDDLILGDGKNGLMDFDGQSVKGVDHGETVKHLDSLIGWYLYICGPYWDDVGTESEWIFKVCQ